jgi:polar amino acid transport system substrate-binding protein
MAARCCGCSRCRIDEAVSILGVTGPVSSSSPRTRGEESSYAARYFLHAAISALACCASLGSAFAQDTPFVPDEWKYGRRQTGSTLQYCLDARDPDLPIARKIGEAIAQALLLEPKVHEIGGNTVGEDIDNLYRVFLESCDLYLGFKLIPDAYPTWLAVTRPYYRTSYILVTANAQWNSLADMPRALAIGATIGTSADIRLIQYLQALPADSRWSRFPMGSDELALRALLRDTVGVALVWGPSFWALRQGDPAFAALRIISSKPLADSAVDVGATLLARESFLRNNVDQAIASLTADGTIQSILDSEKFPAAPVK